jgi:branched-chain amino acid transport system permease protein
MTTALAIQLLLLGLLQGGIYALVACGLTLIYGVMKVVNFAHAEFLTLGMFLAITAFQLFGLNPYTAAPFIFAIVFILGAIAQQIIIRPALRYPQINQMLITIGLSILLVGMMQLLWGPNNQVVKLSWARATFDFEIAGGEVSLSYVRLIAAVVAVAVAGLAWWILKYTRTGNAMRAAAQNPLAARFNGDQCQQNQPAHVWIWYRASRTVRRVDFSSVFCKPDLWNRLLHPCGFCNCSSWHYG